LHYKRVIYIFDIEYIHQPVYSALILLIFAKQFSGFMKEILQKRLSGMFTVLKAIFMDGWMALT
jgi:hypothetical protein